MAYKKYWDTLRYNDKLNLRTNYNKIKFEYIRGQSYYTFNFFEPTIINFNKYKLEFLFTCIGDDMSYWKESNYIEIETNGNLVGNIACDVYKAEIPELRDRFQNVLHNSSNNTYVYYFKFNDVLLNSQPFTNAKTMIPELECDEIGGYLLIKTNKSDLETLLTYIENYIYSKYQTTYFTFVFLLEKIQRITLNYNIYTSYPNTIITSNKDVVLKFMYDSYEKTDFIIDFFINNAESSVLDKTNFLVNKFSLKGTLRESTSILEPSFLVQIDRYPPFNYCYIERFNRYYYITNVTTEANGLWRFDLKVDVLMSFKDFLNDQIALVGRNEYDYNDLLIDDLVPTTYEYTIKTIENKNPHSTPYFDTFFDFITIAETQDGELIEFPVKFSDSYNIILNCISSNDIKYDDSLPLYSPLVCKSYQTYVFNYEVLNDLSEKLLYPEAYGNPASFISSISISPFSYLDIVGFADIGKWKTNYNIDIIKDNKINFGSKSKPLEYTLPSIGRGFVFTSNSRFSMYTILPDYDEIVTNGFLDKEPYSKYYLYFPKHGLISLNIEYLHNKLGEHNYLIVDVSVDNGNFNAYIIHSNTKPLLYKEVPRYNSMFYFSGNFYTSIPFGQTNQSQLNIRDAITNLDKKADITKIFTNLAKGITNTTTMALLGSKSLAISQGVHTAANLADDITSAVVNYNKNTILANAPEAESKFSNNDCNSFYLKTTPYILKISPKFYRNTEYNHFFGRPLYQDRKLSNIKGFTRIAKIHLENCNNATLTEKEELEQLLESGVMFPPKE